MRHAGTTDVDVQVDLEIAAGAVNTVRLEHALVNAEFKADPSRVWRWETEADGTMSSRSSSYWQTSMVNPREPSCISTSATCSEL